MTGRVKTFCPKKGTGLIETENGENALFEIADVLTYDRIGLKPGQVVSFEAGSALPMRAYEIVVRTGIHESPSESKAKEEEDLRYTGFHYEDGARIYSFEERVAGEETRQFRVVTEVELLLEHQISLQETPTICLNLLKEKLAANLFPNGLKLVQCLLSKKDVISFVAAREAATPRRHSKPRRGLRPRTSGFGAKPPMQGPTQQTGGSPRPIGGRGGNYAYGAKGR